MATPHGAMESEGPSTSPECMKHVQFASTGSVLGRPSEDLRSNTSQGVELQRIVPFVSALRSGTEEVRVALSSTVLQCFGRLLRQPGAYKHSFGAKKLDQYWSHSWADRSWKKIVVLLWLHNGVTAMVCGTFAAVAVMVLVVLGVLPLQLVVVEPKCCASLSVGLLVFVLVLLLGRPRRKIFVDMVCINQAEDDAKHEGMLNVGAALKMTRSMLVLWDASYAEKLWPIFELANFLRSHEGEKYHLDIRPTMLAPFFVLNLVGNTLAAYVRIFQSFDQDWIFFVVTACFMPYFIACGLLLLFYFSSVQDLRSQLNYFALDDTSCHCCSLGHVHPQDASVPVQCERKVILECMTTWFGSQECFERYVSSKVSRAFSQRLGNFLCQYWMVVVLAAPIFWGQLDLVAMDLLAGDQMAASLALVVAITWWLAILPAAYVLFIALVAKGQRRQLRRTGAGQKVCWRLIPICALLLVLSAAALYQVFCTRYISNEVLGIGIFGGTLILPCYLIWRASTKNTAMFSQSSPER